MVLDRFGGWDPQGWEGFRVSLEFFSPCHGCGWMEFPLPFFLRLLSCPLVYPFIHSHAVDRSSSFSFPFPPLSSPSPISSLLPPTTITKFPTRPPTTDSRGRVRGRGRSRGGSRLRLQHDLDRLARLRCRCRPGRLCLGPGFPSRHVSHEGLCPEGDEDTVEEGAEDNCDEEDDGDD